MKHFILFYDYTDDYMERRGEFRDAHVKLAKASMDKDEFFLGGAYNNPADGALLIFKANSIDVIEEFVQNDPYVQNGLVTSWKIKEWNSVVGKDAINPII
jgi:uncharacterized protein YciI